MKNAMIFGVTGQDGYYLSKLLLEKGYRVVGVKRRTSVSNTQRLASLLSNYSNTFEVVEGDVTDPFSVMGLISTHAPYEIYNLAAQSHVHTSFQQPSYTFQVNAIGVLNILEAIRKLVPLSTYYQASTSECFGDNYSTVGENKFQNEQTAFRPMSPYAAAKVAAHYLVGNYRKAYGLHASCGILFNHDSPMRGDEFVTQKICKYVGRLNKDKTINKLKLGNLDTNRDFGHAEEYVRAMWLMLQQKNPDDYVIATGETHSIREFCELAFARIGCNYNDYIDIDKSLFRPSEVEYLLGNADKAYRKLGWRPLIRFEQLVEEMVDAQL